MFIFLRISQKNCYELRTHPGFPIRAIAAGRAIHPVSTRLRHLTGSVPRSALRAEPSENGFAFAKNPLTEGARGSPGHFGPLPVLNISASVADEVVMPPAFC